MNDNAYKLTAVDKVKSLLKAQFGDYFKAYFEGDPVDIPESLLPCVVVQKLNGPVDQTMTGIDNLRSAILIKIIHNKKDDFGAPSDDVDLTERKNRRIIEGRDATTGYYLTNSIMYILRHNFTLDNTVVENEIDIAYDLDVRPNDIITTEGYVTINVEEQVVVSSRS